VVPAALAAAELVEQLLRGEQSHQLPHYVSSSERGPSGERPVEEVIPTSGHRQAIWQRGVTIVLGRYGAARRGWLSVRRRPAPRRGG